jgi:hypothetical protein
MTLEEREMFQAALPHQQPLDGVEVAGSVFRYETLTIKVIAILKMGQADMSFNQA